MPRSLKKPSQATLIYNMIRENKYLSLSEVHAFAKSLGCKQRTLERRLNKSEAPSWIQTVYSKGAIAGYKFIKKIL